MKVAFWDEKLSERGTSIALYDYAYQNKLRGNESVIFYDSKADNHPDIIRKFLQEFTIYPLEQFEDIDDVIVRESVDVLYLIKYGNNDSRLSRVCKSVVHCVFVAEEPHADVYAVISKYAYRSKQEHPCVVPHMISLPTIKGDFRSELKIPENATVYGRYGGYHEFDLGYVRETIVKYATEHPDTYFLFMNTFPLKLFLMNT